MRTKRIVTIAFILVVIAVSLALLPDRAGASDGIPEDVTRFYDCGYVCYVWPDGSGDCYLCQGCAEPTIKAKETHTKAEPAVSPTGEKPSETPVPQPTEKVKCNSGRGNGSEGSPDCDPGNSGGHNNGGD